MVDRGEAERYIGEETTLEPSDEFIDEFERVIRREAYSVPMIRRAKPPVQY